MRLSGIALLALASASTALANGWSRQVEADDSPSKLDDCGCWPVYQTMLKCQKIPKQVAGNKYESGQEDVRDCLCIPNPDGWYGGIMQCRTCVGLGSDEPFFDNLATTMNQMFVSCTNVGGGITSDGESICASNAYFKGCASLGEDGKESWSSFEDYRDDTSSNGTYVLDIAQYKEDGEEEEKSSSTSEGSGSSSSTRITGNNDSTTSMIEGSSSTATSTVEGSKSTPPMTTPVVLVTSTPTVEENSDNNSAAGRVRSSLGMAVVLMGAAGVGAMCMWI